MRNILKILTPENVYVEYELAGLGSRFIALVIDSLIQIGLIILAGIGMLIGGVDLTDYRSYNSVVIAIGIVVLFVIWFGYYIFFEMIMNGQSPGKKAVKLRVIKQNGEPIGFFDSFLRNILRIGDMLPGLYLIGTIFITFTRNYKRIGDYAANTIVVKVRKNEKLITIDSLLEGTGYDIPEESVNIYPVNNFEYDILKEFMSRKDNLGQRRYVFAFHLNKYFLKKFNIKAQYNDPYEFFKTILAMNSGLY